MIFASVALFKRGGKLSFKPPRKIETTDPTQARKSAIRYWRGNIQSPDTLHRVFIARAVQGRVEIHERPAARSSHPWVKYQITQADIHEPHIQALANEIGAKFEPDPVPATLVINNWIYRRDGQATQEEL